MSTIITGSRTRGGGGSSSLFIKYVQAGDTFPTTRPDGSALQLGDYVKPKGTLPFTIGTVTFTSLRDDAVWTGVEWLLNANPFQKTSETPVNNKSLESLSGTADYQSNINIENKAAINARVEQVSTLPTAEAALLGKCVQYIGASTSTAPIYEHNCFYEVVTEGTSYKWQKVKLGAGETADVDVSDKTVESLSGASTKQQDINIENVNAIKARIKQVSSLGTATTAMIGKPCVQYTGADGGGFVHNRFYEVVTDGAGGAKWQECEVSEGVKPYINGVLLNGDKSTEDIRISFKGTRAEWNALSAAEKLHRFAVITDENEIPQLHVKLVVNTTTGKLKAQLWDVTDATLVAQSNEVEVQDNEAIHSGAFITTIPAGQTGAGKHGIKFTKADGTFIYVVLEDSADKLITALDTAIIKNKSIDADYNTISNIETDNFKASALSTTIAPAATAVDTKVATEKAVRTELDTKQDKLIAGSNISIGLDEKTISSNQIDDTLSTSAVKTWSVDNIKEQIRKMGATFRGQFNTKADLDAYAGTKENNDRAVVTKDETHDDKTTMYIYNGSAWAYEYVISDKPLEFDEVTIQINTGGKVEVMNNSITPAKMKAQTVDKSGYGLQVQTDGTIEYSQIRQYLRVSTFSGVTGNQYTWYYLDGPDGAYSEGSYVWTSALGFHKVESGTGGGYIFVGTVNAGGTLPTTRPDGSALVLGDWIKPNAADLPFTIGGITFTSAKDTAVWLGTTAGWTLNASAYQKTNDTPVSNKTNESINAGTSTAVYQSEINAENATAINAAAKSVAFEKTSDGKVHLNIKDRKNNNIIDTNIENVVFTEDTQTLKNKTIEAKDNTIDPIIDAASLPTSGVQKSFYFNTADNKLYYTRDNGTTWREVGAGQIIQVDTIPTASVSELGRIVQYKGTTTTSYTNGRFYKCVSDGAATPTYSWKEIIVSSEIFVAEYNSTTPTSSTPYTDVEAAYNAGKTMMLKVGTDIYPFRTKYNNVYIFAAPQSLDPKIFKAFICASTGWTTSSNEFMYKDDIPIIQVETMPTAEGSIDGKIVQFIGTTTSDYSNGYFYKCVENAGVYSWENINVQPGGGGGTAGIHYVTTLPSTGDNDHLYFTHTDAQVSTLSKQEKNYSTASDTFRKFNIPDLIYNDADQSIYSDDGTGTLTRECYLCFLPKDTIDDYTEDCTEAEALFKYSAKYECLMPKSGTAITEFYLKAPSSIEVTDKNVATNTLKFNGTSTSGDELATAEQIILLQAMDGFIECAKNEADLYCSAIHESTTSGFTSDKAYVGVVGGASAFNAAYLHENASFIKIIDPTDYTKVTASGTTATGGLELKSLNVAGQDWNINVPTVNFHFVTESSEYDDVKTAYEAGKCVIAEMTQDGKKIYSDAVVYDSTNNKFTFIFYYSEGTTYKVTKKVLASGGWLPTIYENNTIYGDYIFNYENSSFTFDELKAAIQGNKRIVITNAKTTAEPLKYYTFLVTKATYDSDDEYYEFSGIYNDVDEYNSPYAKSITVTIEKTGTFSANKNCYVSNLITERGGILNGPLEVSPGSAVCMYVGDNNSQLSFYGGNEDSTGATLSLCGKGSYEGKAELTAKNGTSTAALRLKANGNLLLVKEYVDYKVLDAQDIVDNLTSTDATKVLSAKQGKELNDKIGGFLPISGGTMTGDLIFSNGKKNTDYFLKDGSVEVTGTIKSATNATLVRSVNNATLNITGGNSYGANITLYGGSHTGSPGMVKISVNDGVAAHRHEVIMNNAGDFTFDGDKILTVAGGTLTGDLTFSNGKKISDYLPLSGGTMTGTIVAGDLEVIKNSVDNDGLSIIGGKNSGGMLVLYGPDTPDIPGRVSLKAETSSKSANLTLDPEGILLIDEQKEVLVSTAQNDSAETVSVRVSESKLSMLNVEGNLVAVKLVPGSTNKFIVNGTTITSGSTVEAGGVNLTFAYTTDALVYTVKPNKSCSIAAIPM